jgi:HAD superfamily hydrolase (TIGR01549 family)
VLFDVDGTLYHQQRLRACMALELAAASLTLRSIASAARVTRILRTYRTIHEDMRLRSIRGISLAEFQLAETAARLGISPQEVSAVVTEWMLRRPLKYLRWCRRSGLVPRLDELRRLGVHLGVLSDYPAREKLVSLGVAGSFMHVLCTTDAEINALKPDPRGFRRACELWNLTPQEVLYVGDRPDVDARGAVAAGVRCAVVGRRRRRSDEGGACGHIAVRHLGDVGAIVRGE